MKITGTTRIVGIFGDPISHSLSPVMQNAALQKAGIDAVYVPFHVTPEQLPAAVAAIRSLEMVGINLTIPHKEAAGTLVDELDPVAGLAGAVNTIVNRAGRLCGYNTDVAGLLRAIDEELNVDVSGKRVLVAGAGGAARAAVAALATAGSAWIGVANRTLDRAERLVAELAPRLQGTALAVLPLGAELPARLGEPVDLLVNSTAAGLQGEGLAFPLESCLRPQGAVYDMVYGRSATQLVARSRAAGLIAADGLGMLAAQGEEAFRLWFGCAPPAGVMKGVLMDLRGEK